MKEKDAERESVGGSKTQVDKFGMTEESGWGSKGTGQRKG